MSVVPNAFLRLRAGRYLFCRRIPDDLVPRFRQRELIRVLGPSTKAIALRQARRLAVVADQLFAMVKNDPTLSPEQIASLARSGSQTRSPSSSGKRQRIGLTIPRTWSVPPSAPATVPKVQRTYCGGMTSGLRAGPPSPFWRSMGLMPRPSPRPLWSWREPFSARRQRQRVSALRDWKATTAPVR